MRPASARFDNRRHEPMADHLSVLLDRIRSLVRGRMDPSVPSVAEMEHTLTDGYARALELDAERSRLRGCIERLAADVHGERDAGRLRTLTARLESADGDLYELRGLLEALRGRIEHARACAR
jgi:hypothetical protein